MQQQINYLVMKGAMMSDFILIIVTVLYYAVVSYWIYKDVYYRLKDAPSLIIGAMFFTVVPFVLGALIATKYNWQWPF